MSRRHRESSASIAVIVRVRNSGKFLSQCLQSLIGQTYENYQIVIWNDGSTDNSAEVIQSFMLQSPKIILFGASPGIGATSSLVRAIAATSSDLIALVDADDWIERDALEICAGELERNPEVGLVSTLYLEHEESGSLVGLGLHSRYPLPEDYAYQLLFASVVFHLRVWRRKVYEQIKLDEQYQLACDYDLVLQLSEITPFLRIEKPLYHYRLHPEQVSEAFHVDQVEAVRGIVDAAIKRRGLPMRTTSAVVQEDPLWLSWTVEYIT
jgi:glycosyltransferase involved in cell wall biosynthesis